MESTVHCAQKETYTKLAYQGRFFRRALKHDQHTCSRTEHEKNLCATSPQYLLCHFHDHNQEWAHFCSEMVVDCCLVIFKQSSFFGLNTSAVFFCAVYQVWCSMVNRAPVLAVSSCIITLSSFRRCCKEWSAAIQNLVLSLSSIRRKFSVQFCYCSVEEFICIFNPCLRNALF